MLLPTPNDDVIRNLNFLCKTYDGIKKLSAGTQNRIKALNPDMVAKKNEVVVKMDSIKNNLSGQIAKELEFWPVWSAWMKDIPGIGPFIGGNLILLYYYRFIPSCKDCGGDLEKGEKDSETGGGCFICKDCGKKAKGDGVLEHKINKTKDFPNVSKWWAYLGEHVVDGHKPRMKKGVTIDWSPKGRMISYQIGESFNYQKPEHLYKAKMLEFKEKLAAVYPEKTKGHIHAMARMKTSKLFLSHFWHVAREMEGKSTRGVYADVILNHTGIIAPFYYEPVSQ